MAGDVSPLADRAASRVMQDLLSEPTPVSRLLLVLDQRIIFRQGLQLWFGSLAPEFEAISLTESDSAPDNDLLARASVVVLSSGFGNPFDDPWLREQAIWLGDARPDLPLVLIGDARHASSNDAAISQWKLSGYIPDTSGKELVTAALRLILAGGSYFPRRSPGESVSASVDGLRRHLTVGSQSRLSPRERAVLALLEHGLPNKVIGHRLGMSQSTVKAHVHSIIGKLNVRNRTEAAVARFEQLERTSGSLPPPGRTSEAPAVSMPELTMEPQRRV